jgi:hypothetical protein
VTWSTTTAWITLTAGLKHAATFCMILQLYYEFHQGGLVWFWGLPRSLSWLAGVLSTLPNPSGLDPGASASDRAQHLALQMPTSHQAKKRFWSTLWWSGTGKGRISCICCQMLCTSLSKPYIPTAATLSSSNSALLPSVEHANSDIKKYIYFNTQSWASAVTRAHGIISTLSGDTHVLTHRPTGTIVGDTFISRDQMPR